MENPAATRSLEAISKTNSVFCNDPVDLRVVHRWEARNHRKGMALMGVELLLLDTESTAVQGFIPARLLPQFNHVAVGKIFTIRRFMLRPAKEIYRVADHKNIVVFTDQTTALLLQAENTFPGDRFRLRLYAEFKATAGTDVDLFDVVGEVMLTDVLEHGRGLGPPRKSVSLHLRLKDGETMRVHLWDEALALVRTRWAASEKPPTVVMLTTMNCRFFGGVVSLKTTASTRVFFDTDIKETRDFTAWLADGAPGRPTLTGSTSAVTKVETATIDELHQFLQSADPSTFEKASFYTNATIVAVPKHQTWTYISCSKCPRQLGKGTTSMYCGWCKITNNIGLTRFRFEVSARDDANDTAPFVLFDEAAIQLLGKTATDLLDQAEQAGGGEDARATTPPCFKALEGSKWKFEVQITKFNLTAARQTFTVKNIMEIEESANTIDKENMAFNSGDAANGGDKRAGKRPRLSG